MSGCTKNRQRLTRGSSRLRPARSARSRGRRTGRFTWRRRTAISCRSMTISTARFASSENCRRRSCSVRTKARYRNERATDHFRGHWACRRKSQVSAPDEVVGTHRRFPPATYQAQGGIAEPIGVGSTWGQASSLRTAHTDLFLDPWRRTLRDRPWTGFRWQSCRLC